MADQPTTPSGSRWEPTPGEGPAEGADSAEIDQSTATPTAGAAEPTAPPIDTDADIPAYDAGTADAGTDATDDRRALLRRRAVLAGAATALALGGGIVGFVIGHSSASSDSGFRPANFSNQGPGGQLGEQRPRGFGDGGHGFRDRGGNGFGQPPQGPNGSSSSNSGTGTGT